MCVCVSVPDSWGYLHAHTVSHAVTQASCWALITSDKAWLAFYLGEPGLIWKSLSLTKRDPFLKDSKAKVKPDFAPLPLYFSLLLICPFIWAQTYYTHNATLSPRRNHSITHGYCPSCPSCLISANEWPNKYWLTVLFFLIFFFSRSPLDWLCLHPGSKISASYVCICFHQR